MKIKDNNKITRVPVGRIPDGEVFIDRRRSHPDEMALYMKICTDCFPLENVHSCYAINLATGQMKKYDKTDTVQFANAEVNLVS